MGHIPSAEWNQVEGDKMQDDWKQAMDLPT
jgi:hypothetical protein